MTVQSEKTPHSLNSVKSGSLNIYAGNINHPCQWVNIKEMYVDVVVNFTPM